MNLKKKISEYWELLKGPLKYVNWRITLLSGFTATVFWFFNALNKEYTARINYPIRIVYPRDSLVAVRELPEQLPVNVTGGGWQMLKKTISVNVDPIRIVPENPGQTRYLTGAGLLPMFSEQLDGLNVNYVAVDTVHLQIEPIIQRQLAVAVDSAGVSLEDNYGITSPIRIEPDTINFAGPASLVEELPENFIITLSETDIDRNYDEELSMDLFSSSLITKEPEVIRVRFEVKEFVNRREMVNLEMVNFPYDSALYPEVSQVEVDYWIRKDVVGRERTLDFIVIADLNNMNPQDSTIALEILLMSGMEPDEDPSPVKDITLIQENVKVVHGQ